MNPEAQINVFHQMIDDMKTATMLYVWDKAKEKGQIAAMNDKAKEIAQIISLTEITDTIANQRLYLEEETILSGRVQADARTILDGESLAYTLIQLKEEKDDFHYLTYFMQGKDAIFLLGPDGCFIELNEKALELLGQKSEVVKGLHYEHLLPLEEERAAIEMYFQKALTGEIQTFRATVKAYGQLKHIYVMAVPIIEDNKVVCLYGIIKEEIQYKDLFFDNENQYKTIVENSFDVIALVDPTGFYRLVSKSHEHILGYNPDRLVGRNYLDYIHPHDRRRIQEIFRTMRTTRKACDGLMYRKKRADGSYQLFEGRATPVIGLYGSIKSFVIVARDLTKIQEKEELRRKAEKMEVIGELAAGIAHEIRNPLTTVKGFLEITGQKLEPYQSIISEELKQIDDIVEELLLVARPRSLKAETVFLKDIIEESFKVIENEALMKSATLVLKGVETTKFECVRHQMKQVFINLLKNAVEALEDKGTIEVEISVENNELIAEIKDNGCGMHIDQVKKLGEPFYSIKGKGIGLGLMVCYKIIENHHGTIKINSHLDEGTVVTINLPMIDTQLSLFGGNPDDTAS